MSADNKHIYTAADIERYHRGQMNSTERHALEKAALDDPFLAEAIEGYVHSTDFSAEMADLHNRLEERVGQARLVPITRKKEGFPWMRVAAIIVVLVGGGILASQLLFNKKENEIAQTNTPAGAEDQNRVSDSITEINEQAGTVDAGSRVSDTSVSPAPARNEAGKGAVTEQPRSVEPPSETAAIPPVTNDIKVAPDRKEEQKDLAKNASEGEELAVTEADKVKNRQAMTKARAEKKYSAVQPVNTFRGRVTDENNRGLPFANVTNTRDNVGTYTDVSGNFVLTSPDSVLDVQVRSVGYDVNSQKLTAAAPNNTIVMEDNVDGVAQTLISRSNSNALRRQRDDHLKVEEPEPADGWENYDVYLANNLQVPVEFETRPSAPREVEVSFEVNKQGEPVQFRIERSLCKSCDQEAIRLIREGPKWKRTTKKRTRVTVAF